MSSGNVTIDHEQIQSWVEERGGTPARVKGTGDDSDPGLLRIDFPGYSGEGTLEAISWEDWFEAFEENELAFVFQEQTSDGHESRFSKLVSRDTVKEQLLSSSGKGKAHSKAQTTKSGGASNNKKSSARDQHKSR